MQDLVETFAICDITLTPDEIWRKVTTNFGERAKNAGSATYKGMTRTQVYARVQYLRRMSTQKHIYNDILNPPLGLVTNSDRFFFNNQIIGIDTRAKVPPYRTESAVSWANPALLGILQIPNIHLFVDGTFRSVPKGFAHCFIVMAYDNTTKAYVPIMYTLMTSMTEYAYTNLLHNLIVASDYKLNPSSITCDFEVALRNAIKDQFPGATINGCLFHFKQACRRYLIEKIKFNHDQIKVAMNKEEGIELLTKIPHDEIRWKGIPFVRSIIEDDLSEEEVEKWDAFWKYFDTQWMRCIAVWSLLDENGEFPDIQNRTNNPIERYNKKMNQIFETPHPSMKKFVTLIELEATRQVVRLDNIRHGRNGTTIEPVEINQTIPDSYIAFEPPVLNA